MAETKSPSELIKLLDKEIDWGFPSGHNHSKEYLKKQVRKVVERFFQE